MSEPNRRNPRSRPMITLTLDPTTAARLRAVSAATGVAQSRITETALLVCLERIENGAPALSPLSRTTT